MNEEEIKKANKVLDQIEARNENNLRRENQLLGIDFDDHDYPGDRYGQRRVV